MTRTRAVAIALLGMLVAFCIGFGWQFARASKLDKQLQATTRELGFQKLLATLGGAAADAQRGAYEPARQQASDFFTQLDVQKTVAPEAGRADLDNIASQRDAMITALSRNDPQSGPVLSAMFTRLRGALGITPPTSVLPAPAPVLPEAAGATKTP